MEIYASMVKANLPTPPTWGEPGDDCCSWKPVRCNNMTRRVSHLHFPRYDIHDRHDFPESWSLNTTVFAAFSELQFLDLSQSGLIQFSFDGFKNLSNLRELHLLGNGITGILPSFLFSLPHIEVLDLSFNMLQGPIPINSSSNLSLSLRSLDLSYNDLSGRFSFIWLNNLSNLVEINLSENVNLGVNVNVPGWVPRFQLKRLSLSSCDLDKGIIAKPEFLATQHHLEYLSLRSNNWLFAKGSTLTTLSLRNNSVTGSLEPTWYPQTSLAWLDISMNHIVGQLPANISLVFPGLIYISVANNNFFGEIPMSLCHINQIETINLYNKFSGEMPDCLSTDIRHLWILRVSNNHLSGPIFGGRSNLSSKLIMIRLDGNKFEGAMPRNLAGGELIIMNLRDNKLTGELDASSWNLSVQSLSVSGNYMSAEIQPLLCALPSIKYLNLSNIRSCNSTSLVSLDVSMNSLSGDVSWEHFNTSNLIVLEASHNMLTGNLSWVHRLPLIKLLSLEHNEFHGQIPRSICELKYLWIINLSHNELFGSVLPCMGDISFQDSFEAPFMKDDVFAYFYQSSDALKEDSTFGTKGMQLRYGPFTQRMSGIDLSRNLLSGEIPRELGELSHVKSLNLSGNAFVGPIPTSLSNMSEVESLDLSHNELTGTIPPELTRLRWLAWFSVAYNRLSGCVPSSGQFSTFGEDSYKNNNQLDMKCSSSPPPGLEPGPIPARDETVVDAGTYVVGAASFVLMFWTTIAFSFCHSTGRRMVLKL